MTQPHLAPLWTPPPAGRSGRPAGQSERFQTLSLRALLATLLAAVLLAPTACKREAEAPAAAKAAPTGVANLPEPDPSLATAQAGAEHPGGSAPAAAPRPEEGDEAAEDVAHQVALPGDEDEEEGEEEDKDFWKGIQFDVNNFDEVLDYVNTYYIDATADRKRAWIEAANFALMSLEPSEELLPVSFATARAGKPDEEGRYDGKTEPFLCRGVPLAETVLHKVPSDEYLKAKRPQRKKGRLSTEEVQVLRDKQKARNQAYNEAWKQIPFGRPQFDCVMTYTAERVKQIQAAAAQKAKAAPAKSEAKVDPKAKKDAPPAVAKDPAGLPKPQPQAPQTTPPARPLEDRPEPAKAAKGDKAGPKTTAKEAEDKPKPIPTIDKAWVAAASGYLYALDPHSSVIPRKAWDESTDKTQDASFEGIGAVLTQRDDLTIVENPMEGRPAWRAGIRAGDIIHKVDGVDVSGWLLTKVVKRIRGPRNTKVVLTISRESDPEPKDYAIQRENIEIKNVDGKLLPEYPGIAHVKMTGFVPQSTKDLRQMIDRLASQAPGGKLQGLVLDLRNNSGGLLNKAIEVADMFLPSGRIVSVKSRRKPEEVHEATPSPSDYKFPLVVLVNDGSASASEIVASAIQDNGRGLVVGLRTFGKASVQTLFEPALHTEYYIKLTVARYYAPSGYTIQVVGVMPDVEVAPDVDGKMPAGFREENLNNHLIPIESVHKSPWLPVLPEVKQCVDQSGQAVKVATREPKPQIHPDFQLLRAADHITCLARRPVAVAK